MCPNIVTGLVFKPKTIAKRNLKPLELKTNLNNISLDTNDNEKQEEKTPAPEERWTVPQVEKDKTPVSEKIVGIII